MIDFVCRLGIVLLVVSIYMLLTWILARRIGNAGIVDVAWAFGFVVAAIVYVVGRPDAGYAAFLLISMYVIWNMRLFWHLAVRFKRSHPKEDPRYTDLKQKLGDRAEEKMLLIFLWQGAILTILTAPIAVAVVNGPVNFDLPMCIGVLLWLVSFLGVALSDWQLSEFSKNPDSKGRTCQVGLWRYSRHPNYFFEWLGSVAAAVYVTGLPLGLLSWVCPALLLHLLLNVTGVKPAEEHSAKTRVDYAEYARTTSAFVPWFRKESKG
ncbi:MAG: DUF1295 domain-containing protein [Candidatus Obscuribacterales bacterium]|nr:DUF1295 domain-containing protein [Candidatus Obscuribacterales bacterium]